ncbi:MAG: tetratricopeptide repeat protein [Saprospiraceae bacterium]|nr:tetratricopeptide repeat protein [Saprospiraceae bacterium]
MRYLLLLSVLFYFSACQQDQTKVVEIPELLDRSEKLQYSIEWSETRNKYADLKYKLKQNPENIEAKLQLCNLYITEARITGEHGHYYPAALAMTESVLNNKTLKKDDQFLALSFKASVQLSLHDFKNALVTAQKAVELNPHNAQIYGSLVDAYVELGNYDAAVEYADKMVSIRPDLRSYSRISYLREIHGMIDESIEAMKMAVEAGSPGSEEKSWAALQLAQLCFRYDKVREAESILNQILTEREDYPFAIGALAEINMKEKNYEEAERRLIEACQIIPEVSFCVNLAEIYKIQNRQKELDSILLVIKEMLNDDIAHGHNMSLEYSELFLNFYSDPTKAMEYIKKDLEMRPNNIDINLLLAKIYALSKDKEKAEFAIEKAMATNSKNPEFYEIKNELKSL